MGIRKQIQDSQFKELILTNNFVFLPASLNLERKRQSEILSSSLDQADLEKLMLVRILTPCWLCWSPRIPSAGSGAREVEGCPRGPHPSHQKPEEDKQFSLYPFSLGRIVNVYAYLG